MTTRSTAARDTLSAMRAAAHPDRPPVTVAGTPVTGRPVAGDTKWEEANGKVVFYCPHELLAAVRDEMARSGRSKSQVIVDALRHELKKTASDSPGPHSVRR